MDEILDDYLNNNKSETNGIPTVLFLSKELTPIIGYAEHFVVHHTYQI
jgi:hypothetical protein